MEKIKRNIKYYFCTDCNLKCEYCNIVEDANTNGSSISSIDQVLQLLEEYKDNIDNIIIFGGEPLQLKYRDRLIEELTLIASTKSDITSISIITNGYDRNMKGKINLINELINIYPDLEITTSWDGFDLKATESFILDIRSNIKRINYVISNRNDNQFYDDILYMENLLSGVTNRWGFTPTVEFVFSIERYEPDYSMNMNIIEEQLTKLYKHNPNYEKFRNHIYHLCNTDIFDGIDKSQVIEVFKNKSYESCIERYNYTEEEKEFIKKSLVICKECGVQGCFVCPSRIAKLTLNNRKLINSNYYCKITKLINDIKIREKRRSILLNMLKKTNRPAIELMISTKCNMNCNYCKQGSKVDGKIMDNKTVDNSIKFIKELDKDVDIVLFGGEVLMSSNISVLNYLLDKLKDNNITSKFSLVTNAYDINDKILDILKRIKNEHKLNYLQVSLDGTKDIHDSNRVDLAGKGTFDRILENLKKIKKLGIDDIVTNSVLTFENLKYLPDYILFLEKLKRENIIKRSNFNFNLNKTNEYTLDEVQFIESVFIEISEMYNNDLISIDLFKHLFRLNNLNSDYDDLGCSIIKNIITIDPEGNIIPCHSSVDNYILGNLNTGYFSENIIDIITLITSPKEFHSDLDFCRDCEAETTCSKCKMHNLINYGSINNIPKSYCQLVKSRYNGLVKYFGSIDRFKPFNEDEIKECLTDIDELKELLECLELSNDISEDIKYDILVNINILLKTFKERS